MPNLTNLLVIERCPHCHVDQPNFSLQASFKSADHLGDNPRFWKVWHCLRCGGAVTASAYNDGASILAMYPAPVSVEEVVPDPAKNYLRQAIASLHAPAGSVMLCASAVDAMLKAKGLKKGTLNDRIDKAAEDHLITTDMATWAHEIRLDANDPRHADDVSPLPSEEAAKRSVEFALALAEFLFVLPSKVTRGLERAKTPSDAA